MIRQTLLISMVLAGTAAAQDAAPALPPASTTAPGFVNLQRFDSVSRAGLEATCYVLDGDASGTLLDARGSCTS